MTQPRPPAAPIFFLDENLGTRTFPDPLREAGLSIKPFTDHFRKGTPDSEWIPEVASRGWVLLTLDTRLRYNRLEQQAILEHGLAGFVLVGGRRHDEKAAIFLRARNRVEALLARRPPPFIAKVYADASVKVWLPREGGRAG